MRHEIENVYRRTGESSNDAVQCAMFERLQLDVSNGALDGGKFLFPIHAGKFIWLQAGRRGNCCQRLQFAARAAAPDASPCWRDSARNRRYGLSPTTGPIAG